MQEEGNKSWTLTRRKQRNKNYTEPERIREQKEEDDDSGAKRNAALLSVPAMQTNL